MIPASPRAPITRIVLALWRGLALAGVLVYLLWPWLPLGSGTGSRTITLYGFSILGEAINEGVFPAFARHWYEKTGEKVELVSAFAGSGTVTNQIRLGAPAQVAILSLELDALALQEAGLVDQPAWRSLPYQGVLNRTPMVILTRPGNPKKIRDFADLAAPGVGVVHPDPLTSGGAQWALLAEYGGALGAGHDQQRAQQQLLGLWHNVIAQASSARGARTQFEAGFGDALVTYEQELLLDSKPQGEVVYPRCTVLTEHIVVPLYRNVPESERELVEAFLEFLWSREAQSLFVAHGFRSTSPELDSANPDFGRVDSPFTVADLGGWVKARETVVEGVWKAQVLPQLGKR